MIKKIQPIALIPIGDVPDIACKSIAAHLLGYLNLDVDILPPMRHPEYALDKKRLQFDAGMILTTLSSEIPRKYAKVLGVVNVDLFVPILTHVYGEARQGGRCAVVSLFRLAKSPEGFASPFSLLLERAAKVAIHEMGHLFNIEHCMDKKCLMHFSPGMEDIDQAPLYFCRYCTLYLRDAFGKPITQ